MWWPIADGIPTEFNFNRIRDLHWNPDGYQLSVMGGREWIRNWKRKSIPTVVPCFPGEEAYQFLRKKKGEDWYLELVNGTYTLNGVLYYGELRNTDGISAKPPPMKLPLDPVAGDVFTVDDAGVYCGCSGRCLNTEDRYAWSARVIHVDEPWGKWPRTVRTGLIEPLSGRVYNYVFAWQRGLVHWWYNLDGMSEGREAWAVAN